MKFTKELHLTSVGYLYVSEHHLMHTDLKACMRDIIRANRPCVSQVSVTLIPVPPGDPERCRGHTVAWQVSRRIYMPSRVRAPQTCQRVAGHAWRCWVSNPALSCWVE